jgi:hypothetical protein
MAEAEVLTSGVQAAARSVPEQAELVFGLPSYAAGEQGRELIVRLAEATALINASAALILPQSLEVEPVLGLPAIALQSTAAESNALPWLASFLQMRSIARAAMSLQAKSCVILGPDAYHLSAGAIAAFAEPILKSEFDLAMPRYPLRPAEGLLNRGILYPLTRSLYGKRVHFQLPMDAVLTQPMMRLIGDPPNSKTAGSLPWLSVEAAVAGLRICEVPLAVHHQPRTDGADLTAVLASVLGPLFQEMETHASFWQRSRGSVEVPQRPNAVWPETKNESIDAQRMIESFMLGSRNLQEIWSLVLPPVTLFELKKLARLSAEQFHMADSLWVRIVYDFALAHRLRTINRAHIFGALTPLYLGWVASYALEIGATTSAVADARTEKLAAAFEADKSYLLSRWRWPDRFNP